jgi:integrase
MTRKFNFTNRSLASLPNHDASSPSSSAEYSDTQVRGLRMTVGKTGTKTFGMRYQTAAGIKRFARIGTFPAIELAEARAKALEMRAILDRGGDPLEDNDRLKAMPSFAAFVNEEYLPFARQAKKSFKDDESKFRCHLLPKFGERRLCDISVRDIQLHHAEIRTSHSAATANRHLALLKAVFRKAIEWNRLTVSPAASTRLFRENSQHQRFLTPGEIGKIYAAMELEHNKTAVAALKLLLLTGTRRQEALRAKWVDVDLERGQWFLPETKSGRGRYVGLSEDAKALLAAQPSRGTSQWVFPGRDPQKPLNNPRKALSRILAAAGVDHIRIHDLRHTNASLAINSGASLFEVQNLLGHSTPQVTQRYAHLTASGLLEVSETIASVINEAVKEAQQEAQ